MNKSFSSFLIAVVIIIVISVGAVYGITALAKYFPSRLLWNKPQDVAEKKLPEDIPLYKGAVLAESKTNGDRLTFTYMLPLGAQTTARDFYETEMPKRDWQKLVVNDQFLEFYKREGKRRTLIRVLYQNGRATLIFEITGNAASV